MLNQVDLSRVDLNLLTLFDAVLEQGHVGRAADRMNLTASAVSHGLARLRRLLNDPLFLRTPKGVVPTARALELAAPIAEVLARVRSVVATAEPFDPARSTRRFALGAPDGVSAVLLPPLLAQLRRLAPGIGLSVRQLLPDPGEASADRAWRSVFATLEARAVDIAILPVDQVAPRFHARPLYEEDFVIAMRAGHPLAGSASLDAYCAAQHLVVSHAGDPTGFIDTALAAQGRSRQVILTVPNFLFALTVISHTDLVAALPRRFAGLHARNFGVVAIEPPLPLERFRLHAVAPQVAMMDAGLAWLFGLLEQSGAVTAPVERKARKPQRTARAQTA